MLVVTSAHRAAIAIVEGAQRCGVALLVVSTGRTRGLSARPYDGILRSRPVKDGLGVDVGVFLPGASRHASSSRRACTGADGSAAATAGDAADDRAEGCASADLRHIRFR